MRLISASLSSMLLLDAVPRSHRLSTIGPLSNEEIIQKHVEAAKAMFSATQDSNPILNGRPFATRSTPVHLYHDVFTTFTSIYNDRTREIPLYIQKHIFEFCQASSELYIKLGRKSKRFNAVLPMYRVMLDESMPFVRAGDSEVDAAIPTMTSDGRLALRGLLEVGDEIGASGCDPGLQGCLSYIKYWSTDGVHVCLTLSTPD